MNGQDGTEKSSSGPAEHMDPESCRLVAAFFAILANPTRVAIFCELRDGRKTVSELAEICGISLPNASQHLRSMREKGMVSTEKEGQHVYYAIVDERFVLGCKMIRDALVEHMQQQAGAFEAMPQMG